MNQLTLSTTNRRWGGVIGGVARYLNTDPEPLRILWVLLTIASGIIPGVMAYMLAWLFIPANEQQSEHENLVVSS